jgi:LmbE family N-acetylglucosaminyl deacetylase
MNHLFLSPHLDDAPLSCGGLIHRLAGAGQGVTLLTVCAGDPPAGRLSDYALSLHARWGQPPEQAASEAAAMIDTRRAEDRAAAAVLGAQAEHLDLPDLIYRRSADGSWLVSKDADLFAGFRPADAAATALLAERILAHAQPLLDLPDGRLYLPLGIGGHGDHHLVRRAAESALAREPALIERARYYEDYPYAEDAESRDRTVAEGALGRPLLACRESLDTRALDTKVRAVACYASQISSFWPDLEAMERAIRGFAEQRGGDEGGDGGPAEIYWRLGEPSDQRAAAGDAR